MAKQSIVDNKSNRFSKEQKGLMEENERELASKLDREFIESNKYPKEFNKFDKDIKKELRQEYKHYKETLLKQEKFPGQFISDNDVKNLTRLVILEHKERDLDFRVLTTLDIDEENKLGTMLTKISKEIKSIRKDYPLEASSIKDFSRDIDTDIKEQDPIALMMEQKLKKQQQRKQQKEKVGE